MKNPFWFYLGLGFDALALLMLLSNLFLMRQAEDGLSAIGRIAVVALPLVLVGLIAAAFWLRSAGRTAAATILVWLPALPVAGGIVIWGGLAILFMLFGK